jgi:protein TonB
MFSNLIESGSHAADLKRKGSFFLGTVVFYGVLLCLAGVGSIYAYNARLDATGDYEVLALMRFPPAEARSEPSRPDTPRPAANSDRAQQLTTRTEISVQTPYHADTIARETTREVSARAAVVIAPFDSDALHPGGPIGPNIPGGTGPSNTHGDTGPVVQDTTGEAPPLAVRPTPTPQPQRPDGPLHLSTGVLTGKAIHKPAPPYPNIAKQAGIRGAVAVQVLIDEQGRVLSAKATSGHPLLQGAAVQAAYQARFSPTLLGGQPVKVTGIITYNFVLE